MAQDPQPQAYLDEIEEFKKLYAKGLDLAMEVIGKESALHKPADPYLIGEHLVGEIVDVMARELMGLEEPIDDRFHVFIFSFHRSHGISLLIIMLLCVACVMLDFILGFRTSQM